MNKKLLKLSLFLLIAGLQSSCAIFPPAQNTSSTAEISTYQKQITWIQAGPGISYGKISIENTSAQKENDLFLIKINPQTNKFEIYENATQETALTIKEIGNKTGALMVFNGGLFTEDFKPTGLLISDGEKIKSISSAGLLNGIFALDQDKTPHLLNQKDEIPPGKFPFALQSGPVLLENNQVKIAKDSGKSASRTIIGIDNNNDIILIFIKQSLLNSENTITLYALANLIKNNPELAKLGLTSVLNLDGGTSTGFMLLDQYYPEFERVQNVVIVKPWNTKST